MLYLSDGVGFLLSPFSISMPGLTGLDIVAIANSETIPIRLIPFTASIDDRELVMAAAAGA